ncbi:septum formation initiator family protein [Flammeovirga sp. SJP92]|uniref:FtsB family cell division protein n=1 Tax=Flammeovirga sp. SJP92 TaxID=1775430 RepID=UPI0007880E61|nr:hypothetical protein [Flammeovirga sp. SJP92]KXX71580.1 hypothetical protein AVL50_04720 [Flammeovirga sp. SJP92]
MRENKQLNSTNYPDWLNYFKNFYVLVGTLFLVWMLFFDSDNFIRRRNQKEKEFELKSQEAFYEKEIVDLQEKMRELHTNNQELEKFSREKYIFHKKGEDVYVIKDLSKED